MQTEEIIKYINDFLDKELSNLTAYEKANSLSRDKIFELVKDGLLVEKIDKRCLIVGTLNFDTPDEIVKNGELNPKLDVRTIVFECRQSDKVNRKKIKKFAKKHNYKFEEGCLGIDENNNTYCGVFLENLEIYGYGYYYSIRLNFNSRI